MHCTRVHFVDRVVLIMMLLLLILCLGPVLSADVDKVPDEFDLWMTSMVKMRQCYGDLGCFDLQNPWFSWSRPIPVLPQAIEVVNTKFYIVTRQNPEPTLLKTRPRIDIDESYFGIYGSTVFIVHGYIGHYSSEWISNLTEQLLRLYNVNIILVDWADGANTINYIQAVANTRLVGAELVRFATYLIDKNLTTPKQMHLIGFSLGSHVVSYISENITNVHRITAFDPAQPGFEQADPLVRIDPTDAEFVDAIHTNGVSLIPDLGFGLRESVGDVDFFVNGGETQPGCKRIRRRSNEKLPKKQIYSLVLNYMEKYDALNIRVDNLDDILNLLGDMDDPLLEPGPPAASFSLQDFLAGKITSLFEYVSCSHKRAPQYFTESLQYRNCSFWGVPWNPYKFVFNPGNCTFNRCSELGVHSELYPARGNFYVNTNIESPFCFSMPEMEAEMKNIFADKFLKYIFT